LLTDNRFYNLGHSVEGDADKGRGGVLWSKDQLRAFKTPSLINVSQTAPYFHDGRFNTLEAVVEFYNQGGDNSTNPSIRPLFLTEQDKADLVNYLGSLKRDIQE
jgi:cytochrome c peroxidase